jgi:2-phosphosulfolactate phosphatase
MTTTNGTRAILASLEAERVLIGAFVNLEARVLYERDVPVHIVCAGTEGFISFEDSLCAGAFVERLGGAAANDEARIAHMLWRSLLESDDFDDEAQVSRALFGWISGGRGGQNVRRIGLQADILVAAQLNRFDFMPKLRREPLRIARDGRSKWPAPDSESGPLPPGGEG